ncbi:MAG: glycosyltransferase family 2 protein [Chloroflexi bacterium]|nr:glycosyltransferase family 2 protein [Chloroflexota bacterium]
MAIAFILFWGSLALIVYTYALFPVLVFVRGLFWRQPYKSADITPSVSLVIAAYNEAKVIAEKLDNILALDYPRDRLEILIASDGSNDGTDAIVQRYTEKGVRLLSLPRQGKAGALNSAVATTTGEILVFSDANSMFAPDAIRALVRPFADPEVGGVAGNQCYQTEQVGSMTGAGETSYWNFDRGLKQAQSQSGNTISATGAIYAFRRALFTTVATGVTDDFATSTAVIAQGYRLVFAPNAKAYEPVAGAKDIEFGRKVRVITRGLRAVLLRRELLNPFRYGFYALQLFSHKVLRRLVVLPLLVLVLVSPFLWSRGLFYRLVTVAQVALYACSLLGMLLANQRIGRSKIFTIPFFFCMVNAASLMAVINLIRGRRIDRWEPQRKETLPGSSTPSKGTPGLTPKKSSLR